jgi:hypothetical protein
MAVNRAGAHKVLFGSDGPWLHPGVELQKVYALKLPAKAEALVLGGNFLRLIKNVRSTALPQAYKTILKTPQTEPVQQEYRDPWAVGDQR